MSLHENLDRKTQVRLAAERDLGLVFAAFFLLVSLAPLRHGQPLRGWALFLSAGFLVVTVLRPMWLRPLNKLWSRLGLVMSQVTTPIITTLLFLVVVVPLGFILLQRDVRTCTLLPATLVITRIKDGKLTRVRSRNLSITGCRYSYDLKPNRLGVGMYRADVSINGIMVGHAAFAVR